MKSFQSETAGALALRNEQSDAAARFEQLAGAHRLWRHPFVERCRAGELTLAHARVLGGQMYKFCRSFPRFLCTALAACKDEEAYMVIAENLWEELGEGDPQLAHAALFRRFTQALGLDDALLAAVPSEPETAALIDTYLGLSARYGAVGILGALCYASEGIVGALYANIQRGLLQAVPFDKESLVFFEVHVDVDDGHADKLESILLPMLRTPEDMRLVEAAIEAALEARCQFFDGVLRAAEAQ